MLTALLVVLVIVHVVEFWYALAKYWPFAELNLVFVVASLLLLVLHKGFEYIEARRLRTVVRAVYFPCLLIFGSVGMVIRMGQHARPEAFALVVLLGSAALIVFERIGSR